MPEFDAKKMDDAANDASLELEKIKEKFPDAVEAVEEWTKQWVRSAGYKRLAKILAGKWE
jgi:alkylhydroperoxidase/carboxymuconolactone decarboxylase family protein YurZ